MKKFIKDNWIWILSFIIVFLCSLVLPFSGDDFDWAMKSLSDYGSLLVDSELNGRYVGNFLVIIITKNIVIRSLFTAGVLTGIAYFITKEAKAPLFFVWLLLILMPLPLLVQDVVWASGFANYAISTLLVIPLLLNFREIYLDKSTWKRSIGTGVLLLLSCFFVENVTIFILLVTIILNVIYVIRNKKVNKALLVMLCLVLLGTVLMFIQPAYHNVIKGDDFYRSLPLGLVGTIKKAIINYVFIVHEYIAFDNVLLLMIITGALYVHFKRGKTDLSRRQKSFLKISFYYSFGFLAYAFLNLYIEDFSALSKSFIPYLNASLCTLYIALLIAQIIVSFYKTKTLIKLLLPLLCIVGLVAPLLLVTPLGPRNFFVVYILEVIEALYILNEIGFDYKKVRALGFIVIAVMVLYYVCIYAKISYVNLQRNNYVKEISNNTDNTEVTVPLVPFNEFVHYDNFSDKMARPKYNRWSGVRDDFTYKFVSYEDWVKIVTESGYIITP